MLNAQRTAADLPTEGKQEDGALIGAVMQRLEARYAEREAELTSERMRMIERFLMLNTIDSRWKEHLRAMDALKAGIGLRGYAQIDPKVEYKREGFEKFQLLLAAIAEEVTSLLFRLQVKQDDADKLEQRWSDQQARRPVAAPGGAAPAAGASAATLAAMQRGRERAVAQSGKTGPVQPIVRQGDRVGRNDPCPCGSGKKYKKCCFPKFET